MLNSPAYGFAETIEPLDESEIKTNIEEEYGIKIIYSQDDKNIDYMDCMLVLERSLRRFPEGVIKEITDYYSQMGIETNVVINKTEKIADLFSEYVLADKSATVYINALQNSMYNDECVASEESTVYEISHLISDYMYEIYGHERMKNDFLNFNSGFQYGNWEECSDVFINKHSAMSFEDEVADLIWYTEVHPELLRTLDSDEKEIIHKKIEYLAEVFDECFDSVSENTRLWMEAVPQEPDKWALETVTQLKNASLIPDEFDGIYDAYITKENFYTLIMNVMESKLGADEQKSSLNMYMQEEYVSLDPVKGEIFMNDGMYVPYSSLLCSNKEVIYKAYQMGFLGHDGIAEPDSYMTRLEAAKMFAYIANEQGMDISDYEVINYNDLNDVKDQDKTFIYYAATKGILKGYGYNFNPYGYCTYQETYIMLMRLYNIL
jgi:hypothetical protein